jgi:uncharacterized protein YyaL (SSP411 family)
MASNLYKLSIYFDRKDWYERSINTCSALGSAVVGYPTSFGCWANQFLEFVTGTNELAIIGEGYTKALKEILAQYIPNKIVMAAEKGLDSFALLTGKKGDRPPLIYLCRNYTCQRPVQAASDIVELLLNS